MTECIHWNFNPTVDVRADVTREVVFVKRWQKLMRPDDDVVFKEVADNVYDIDKFFIENEGGQFPILRIFESPGFIPNENTTRIASNMIYWLGTNAGRLYLEIVGGLVQKGVEPDIAYLGEWARQNISRRGFSSGYVPRDRLAQIYNDAGSPNQDTYDNRLVGNIRTLELMVLWLTTKDGQDFVAGCERNLRIKAQRQREESVKHLGLRIGN